MEDLRLTVVDLIWDGEITTGSVHESLTEELGMRKLMIRWVSHLSNSDQNHVRIKLFQQQVHRFQKNKTDFVCRFVTINETCVYYYYPEL